MMANLADYIEAHLRRLLDMAKEGSIEIRRRELADRFNCVPSQINYVISTRFTSDRGYLVESRRGEGGYIRIFRIRLGSPENVSKFLDRVVGDVLTEQELIDVLYRLKDANFISNHEELLIRSIVQRYCENMREKEACRIRAKVFEAVTSAVVAMRNEYDDIR